MEINTRQDWLNAMIKIASPVLENLSEGNLKKVLSEDKFGGNKYSAPLEAFGRTACGIAPWLELEGLTGEEAEKQRYYRKKMRLALDMATDKNSPDYMVFTNEFGDQPLVDAAFLAHALVRAPKQLVESLDGRVRTNVIEALRLTRCIVHSNNNWIFFSAMVEAALYLLGDETYDLMRVEFAFRLFEQWYCGDGLYGDGEDFHWDYYNSFVIQPMYVDVISLFEQKAEAYPELKDRVIKRAARYASILERLIAPDGTYPVIGRSIAYRFGAFQMLGQAALQHLLESHMKPAQVRCALSAVIGKVMENEEMFQENGWLQPGVYGLQPELAEFYINTGSLYLCMAVFLPLGLPLADEFWSAPEEDWTGKKVWSGKKITIDKALSI